MKKKSRNTLDAHSFLRQGAGFTLIELMVSIVIASLILGAAIVVYKAQSQTQAQQEQVAELQQNIRAAVSKFARDARMAGYDPTGGRKAGIVTATPGEFKFTMDLNGNGLTTDQNETVSYRIPAEFDANGDGVVDTSNTALPPSFARKTNSGEPDEIAYNIEELEFVYLLSNVDACANKVPNSSLCAKLHPASNELDRIRAVTVTLLMRSNVQDTKFHNDGTTYSPASHRLYGIKNHAWQATKHDQYRRRLYFTTIQLRNMGL